MILGYFVDGIGGGYCVIKMAGFAYISDITTAQNRPLRTFIIEITMSCSFFSGALACGYILNATSFACVYFIALTFAVLAFLYIVFFLSEQTKSSNMSNLKLLDFTHFKRFNKLFVSTERRLLYVNMILYFLYFFCDIAINNVGMLRAIGNPICFNSKDMGIFTSTNELVQICAGLLLLKALRKHVSNEGFIVLGLCFGIGSQLGYILAWNKPSMYLGESVTNVIY